MRHTCRSRMEGFVKCSGCGVVLHAASFKKHLRVCIHCGFHHWLPIEERIAATLDEGSFLETDQGVTSANPLEFERYSERMAELRARGRSCAVVTGTGRFRGFPVVLVFFDFTVYGGSIGSAEGEKIARAFERSVALGVDLVSFVASGGARMQEGLFSLMQVAKMVGARSHQKSHGRRHITVLCDPSMAGALISFAMLAEVKLAEVGARVAFSGSRVAGSATTPCGEDYCEWGEIDEVVQRSNVRLALCRLIKN